MLKFIKKLLNKDIEALQLRGRIVLPAERSPHIFAIGDIHGHLDLLLDAERRILARMKSIGSPAIVVCVGDFVDRGPDSKGVIDHLIRKLPPPLYRICICGNHDDAFFDFVTSEEFDPAWLDFGGDKTLMSYGVDVAGLLRSDPKGMQLKQAVLELVPAEHIDFLDRLPVALTVGKFLFVHAGIVPGRPLVDQSDNDLMWIREPFLSRGPGLDITVVHGHTPSTDVQYGPNRLGVDTGAYATGKLSVVHIGPHGVVEI